MYSIVEDPGALFNLNPPGGDLASGGLPCLASRYRDRSLRECVPGSMDVYHPGVDRSRRGRLGADAIRAGAQPRSDDGEPCGVYFERSGDEPSAGRSVATNRLGGTFFPVR